VDRVTVTEAPPCTRAMTAITVAIPTLNAGPEFAQLLVAVCGQRVDAELELLVCDSGSTDGTVALARRYGARVLEIPRERFSHGGTRNLLASEARGGHIAFLTQDAIPADPEWLATLCRGFTEAPDVGLVFGPYRPRPEASLSVRRELIAWFDSLAPAGTPRIDTLAPEQAGTLSAADFLGPLGYFTDANGCLLRSAWERVPFREVAYAEDHLLAQDMLRAGYAKVYEPRAGVIHSHEYSAAEWLRRSFDETRAVAGVYGVAPSGRPRDAARNLRGNVAADVRQARIQGGPRGAVAALTPSFVHHGARTLGALLGARSERIPRALAMRLSLERRG
jgi:glycosyltransferase involved in cell wall biosynthesis